MNKPASNQCKAGTCPNSSAGGGRDRCAYHHIPVAQRPHLPNCSCRVVAGQHLKTCAWRIAVEKFAADKATPAAA